MLDKIGNNDKNLITNTIEFKNPTNFFISKFGRISLSTYFFYIDNDNSLKERNLFYYKLFNIESNNYSNYDALIDIIYYHKSYSNNDKHQLKGNIDLIDVYLEMYFLQEDKLDYKSYIKEILQRNNNINLIIDDHQDETEYTCHQPSLFIDILNSCKDGRYVYTYELLDILNHKYKDILLKGYSYLYFLYLFYSKKELIDLLEIHKYKLIDSEIDNGNITEIILNLKELDLNKIMFKFGITENEFIVITLEDVIKYRIFTINDLNKYLQQEKE